MSFFLWIKKIFFFSTYFAFIICGLYACASIGSPGGGEYDIEPPRIIRSDPEPNTINFEKNKISIWFDEYVVINNPVEKVIITPPQTKIPVIKAVGKRINVELKDSLIPNTTYTLDFTDAIVDNNENNALEGFSFAFSTGNVVDSLEISGLLINAEDLEPMPRIIVGIHSDLSDSAFLTKPFTRTSKTNDRGQFSIKNIAPGTYRLFALDDKNRDFKFDNQEEAIAFYDSLVIPSYEPAIRMDTIWKDSITIDTVKTINYTRFTPDNIILKLFNEKRNLQYLVKTERINAYQFTMEFNSEIEELPHIILLNNERKVENWYMPELSDDKKIIKYWIPDSLIYQKDTLFVQANYLSHDTLNNLVEMTDTLKLFLRGRNRNRALQKVEEEKEPLTIEITPTGIVNVYDTIKIKLSEPLFNLDPNLIILEEKVDTLWKPIEKPLIPDSLNPLVYHFNPRWPYKNEYQIRIDSASISSVYGKFNNPVNVKFRTRAEDEYANLYVQISGIEPIGFGQLLNRSGNVVKESFTINGELRFEDILPGKYYLRYIDDKNKNGKWDTGVYMEKVQPEDVYYYPGEFELKKYVEVEQNWNVTMTPINRQKPFEIIKNKPQEKKPKRNRNEERNQQRNDRNTSGTTFPGL